MKTSLFQRVGAVVAAVAVASLGTSPLIAASTGQQKGVSPATTLEAFARNVDALSKTRDVDSERVKQMQLRLRIASAKTPKERHELIRQLPVKIAQVREEGPQGRLMNVYSVADKELRRSPVFVAAPEPVAEGISGPSAMDEAPPQTCYYEGSPADCATPEEIEDFEIVLADVEYQNYLIQLDYDTAYNEYTNFCTQQPWACEGVTSLETPDGALPARCAFESCWSKAAAAALTLVTSIGGYLVAESALAAHWGATALLPTAAVLGHTLLMYGAVAAALYTGSVWFICAFSPWIVVALCEPEQGFELDAVEAVAFLG